MKLWGGRFAKDTNELVDRFNASIEFDQRLAADDIIGSIAHARMLGKCGILTADESRVIISGLTALLHRLDRGKIEFSVDDEDVHMNVERLLGQEIGSLAGKLHTARSRNDQVALDTRLFLRRELVGIVELVNDLAAALLERAAEHLDTIMPGYTHLQRAQPILLAHHLLAYWQMLTRDAARLRECWARVNVLPLGAGALAGTTFPIDRAYVAELLGFDSICANSLDAVSDRDYQIELLSTSALLMTHLSRLSEELILWSSNEFGFIEIDDAFATGSSMMPQKKNPDVAELVRGKVGRTIGNWVAVLTTLKGLPLAYNKDLQEDKERLFDTVDTLTASLAVFAPMIRTVQFRAGVMRDAARAGFSNATDMADYLARKGMAFREAHEVVGKLVKLCLERGVHLSDLPIADLKEATALFEEDVFRAISVENVVNARTSVGGTARSQVELQLADARVAQERSMKWVIDARARVASGDPRAQ